MRGALVRKGSKWYVVLYQGRDPLTGRERRRWVAGFDTKDQAEGYRVVAAQSAASGSGVGLRGSSRLRLGDYLARWLRTEAKARCRPKELRRREEIVRIHLTPRLGHIPLAKLAPATIEDFFASLGENRSANHIFTVLRTALNHAVRTDLILANPCGKVTGPKPAVFHPTLWTVEETVRFLRRCQTDSPHLFPLFLTEISTGLRLGELLGLSWRNVDLETGVVRVVQDLDRPQGGGFHFGDPKSARSRRSVRLPVEVTEELRALRRRHIIERLKRGLCARNGTCRDQHCPLWHDHELVFCQQNGKPVHGHNLTQRTMRRLIERAEVPRVRFHDLRHAHGSLLATSGVNLKIIQERLGHSSETVTLGLYVHATDLQGDAAEAVSRTLLASNGFLTDSAASGGMVEFEENRQNTDVARVSAGAGDGI